MKQQRLINVVTGHCMPLGELESSWQEFVISRQEKFDQETENLELLKKIEGLLVNFNGEKLMEEIERAIIDRDFKIMHIQYNKAFLDGLQLALTLGKI